MGNSKDEDYESDKKREIPRQQSWEYLSNTTKGVKAVLRSKMTDLRPRCHKCNKALALVLSRPWCVICHRCKSMNMSA